MRRKKRGRARDDATPKVKNDETPRSVARGRRRIDRTRAPGGGDEGDLETWLELLFLGLPGSVELRPLEPETGRQRSRRWIPKYEGKAPRITRADLQEAAAAILEFERAGLNVYAGVATRARGGGHKRDLGFVAAAWGDLDHPRWRNASAEELVKACTMLDAPPPSMVVGSGGGLHAYWLLDEPLQIKRTEGRSRGGGRQSLGSRIGQRITKTRDVRRGKGGSMPGSNSAIASRAVSA